MQTSAQLSGAGSFDAARDRGGTAGRVLIVDDDAASRLICAINLTAEGLHVLEAEDGLDALERVHRHHPDLVLTDVNMPRLDGFQLAERLHGDVRTRPIPLIFLTAEVGEANARRARSLGALAYLTKPCDPRGLASLVARELVAARARAFELAAASQPAA